MASTQKITANQINSKKSTGPTSPNGKRVARANATRHGVLGSVVAMEQEADLYGELLADLIEEFEPATPLERLLTEKIAVIAWRSRRLAMAERAALELQARPERVAKSVTAAMERSYLSPVSAEDLQPIDEQEEAWCKRALNELPKATMHPLERWPQVAPTLLAHLKEATEHDDCQPEDLLKERDQHGSGVWLGDIHRYCLRFLSKSAARPEVLEIADLVRAEAALLPIEQQQLVARYQTTLDTQLYKAIAALRDAQAERRAAIDARPIDDAVEITDA